MAVQEVKAPTRISQVSDLDLLMKGDVVEARFLFGRDPNTGHKERVMFTTKSEDRYLFVDSNSTYVLRARDMEKIEIQSDGSLIVGDYGNYLGHDGLKVSDKHLVTEAGL